MFKFLKFKNKVKKNLFLDEEIDINEFSEYKNDYEKSIQKLKNINSEGESYEKKEENDILEVFDFINNVTNTRFKKKNNVPRR
jgi:lysozyme family protein